MLSRWEAPPNLYMTSSFGGLSNKPAFVLLGLNKIRTQVDFVESRHMVWYYRSPIRPIKLEGAWLQIVLYYTCLIPLSR